MGFSTIGVLTVQFHNRSTSVTKDIEIFQSYMTAFSSHHQYLCFSSMDSTPKAMIISWPRHILGFELQIQCPFPKMSWKTVKHHGWLTKENFSILNCNSYLEIPLNCFFQMKSVFKQNVYLSWSYWLIPFCASNFARYEGFSISSFLSQKRFISQYFDADLQIVSF